MSDKAEWAYRTISEVSEQLDVPAHVLRFWETKFTQLKPMKRSGGRRYYKASDLALLSRIRDLLYRDGFTIKGAQKALKEKKTMATQVPQPAAPDAPEQAASTAPSPQNIAKISAALSRLRNLDDRLEAMLAKRH